MTTLIRNSISAAIAISLTSTAFAQWTVIETGSTKLLGIRGSQQVGVNGVDAGVWYGSAASFVDLGPDQASATDGVQQVGVTGSHAALWSGTAGSHVDLHPVDYAISYASGVDAGVQCGTAAHSLLTSACIWTGTADSIVFLTHPGAVFSSTVATGINGGQIVGYFLWSSSHHACVWNGPASAVDLDPSGFTGQSEALGVHSGTQVGWANLGSDVHAALWTGTAASYVDLQPSGATQSIARAAFGALQVGEATIGGNTHASLWNGTSASWIDLHAFVPPGHSTSVATGVWIDENGVVYVSGYHESQGLLWIDASNAITSYCFGDGSGTACPCGNNAASGSGTGCLSSIGVGGKLATSGTPSVSNDTLALLGSQMPASSSVLYFQGTSQQSSGAGAVFGDGLRCVAGSVIRLGTKLNVGGASSYPTAGDPSVSVKGQITQPGVTRDYQVWYRNVAAFCTPSAFNLTNGIAASWIP